jgi:hypothetical protein
MPESQAEIDLLARFTAALDCCGTCAGGVLAQHTRAREAAAWFEGYAKGNLDGYFGTRDERAKSPYADLDPYREPSALPGSYRSCAGCDEIGESCRAIGCPAVTTSNPPASTPGGES